jgi:hypothetical protein
LAKVTVSTFEGYEGNAATEDRSQIEAGQAMFKETQEIYKTFQAYR